MPVLHRATRFDVAQQHPMLFAPGTDGSADKLGPVIDMDLLRQSSRLSELLENPDHAETRQTCVCLDTQAFSRVFVDDRQHTEGTAVRQGVTDKVHRPTLVGAPDGHRCGGRKPLPTVPTLASAHRQPELAIHSVNSLWLMRPPSLRSNAVSLR